MERYRGNALEGLTSQVGVYALCDLDRVPIYIGQSMDSIRARVQRHLTSARSDVIANRQLDVWEISEVWAWPVGAKANTDEGKKAQKAAITLLEAHLIQLFNAQSPLVNGKLPPPPASTPEIPDITTVQVIPEEERMLRLEPTRRLPRQMDHLSNLFGHILEVKNNSEQRRMLRVHFNRAAAYYQKFMVDSGETDF